MKNQKKYIDIKKKNNTTEYKYYLDQLYDPKIKEMQDIIKEKDRISIKEQTHWERIEEDGRVRFQKIYGFFDDD